MAAGARERWIQDHPYLQDLARFEDVVQRAATGAAPPLVPPSFDAYAGDFAAGVPLLQSGAAGIDLSPSGGDALRVTADRLGEALLPEKLERDCRALRDALRRGGEPARLVGWVVHGEGPGDPPENPGLLRFLGWSALVPLLEPVVTAFGAWRDEARWSRSACPTCGSLPVMAQLTGTAAGRQRRLACGACRTCWAYRRIGCPLCGNEDPQRLEVLEVADEPSLRIDACQACNGYVKTWSGEADAGWFLADWTTLHLDLAARERGLTRRGASLYEI